MTRDELTQAALALHVAAGALARVEPLLRRLAGRSHANDGERAAAAMYGRSAQAALACWTFTRSRKSWRGARSKRSAALRRPDPGPGRAGASLLEAGSGDPS